MMTFDAKRIAIFGNHSCSNRGDCAIARGLLTYLRGRYPSAEITLYTRYPESARLFLDVVVKEDPLAVSNAQRRGIGQVLLKLVLKRFFALYMVSFLWRIFGLPNDFRRVMEEFQSYDLFVQVGGSFFVDVYGASQFEGLLLARAAGVPVVCSGHSVGPFRGRLYGWVAREAFSSGALWLLREKQSLQSMELYRMPTQFVTMSGDTAWLVPDHAAPPRITDREQKPIIAVTVRDLAPFDRALGVTQAQYERLVAEVADRIAGQGYLVYFVSTCTGLEGYWRDDRLVGQRIRRHMKDKNSAFVVMDEWSDLELGAFMGQCALVIATRLHSAILAMRFGTPALALGYEHKTMGTYEGLGLGECCLPLTSNLSVQDVATRAEMILSDIDAYRSRTVLAAEREADYVRQTHDHVLSNLSALR